MATAERRGQQGFGATEGGIDLQGAPENSFGVIEAGRVAAFSGVDQVALAESGEAQCVSGIRVDPAFEEADGLRGVVDEGPRTAILGRRFVGRRRRLGRSGLVDDPRLRDLLLGRDRRRGRQQRQDDDGRQEDHAEARMSTDHWDGRSRKVEDAIRGAQQILVVVAIDPRADQRTADGGNGRPRYGNRVRKTESLMT